LPKPCKFSPEIIRTSDSSFLHNPDHNTRSITRDLCLQCGMVRGRKFPNLLTDVKKLFFT